MDDEPSEQEDREYQQGRSLAGRIERCHAPADHTPAEVSKEERQKGCANDTGMKQDIVINPHKFEDGFVVPNDKPGLGVELDDKVVEKFRIK